VGNLKEGHPVGRTSGKWEDNEKCILKGLNTVGQCY
jgi:hypothetical protein